jgi:hypothetical protein
MVSSRLVPKCVRPSSADVALSLGRFTPLLAGVSLSLEDLGLLLS